MGNLNTDSNEVFDRRASRKLKKSRVTSTSPKKHAISIGPHEDVNYSVRESVC